MSSIIIFNQLTRTCFRGDIMKFSVLELIKITLHFNDNHSSKPSCKGIAENYMFKNPDNKNITFWPNQRATNNQALNLPNDTWD